MTEQEAEDKRAEVEQANEVAEVVFDQIKLAWPDLHPVLSLRYGIADALWDRGYRRHSPRVVVAAPSDTNNEQAALHGYQAVWDDGKFDADPAKNAWQSDPLPFPKAFKLRKQKTGFYDPGMNAVILLSGSDSGDDVVVWAYRFQAQE